MSRNAENDRRFLEYAIRIGERGIGTTAPNPSVGAVVVQQANSRAPVIVGEGTTASGGRPHAETQALDMAGTAAAGATLYVSLEPCSHHGKTPPCTDAIMSSGVARVVCALEDPDARVTGRGFANLEAAGVSVDLHPHQRAALAAAGHILRTRVKRPFVRLKTAVSADGLIAPGDGDPVWVTGDAARARGHLLRARADAILVGSGTIRADNPSLTCRLPGLGTRSPVPVVLDSGYATVAGSKILTDARGKPLVFVANETVDAPAECLRVPRGPGGHLDPHEILLCLAGLGVTSVLIEGGPTVSENFLAAGLVDEVAVFQGHRTLHGDGMKPFGASGLERLEDVSAWSRVSTLALGDDSMTLYRRDALIVDLTG